VPPEVITDGLQAKELTPSEPRVGRFPVWLPGAGVDGGGVDELGGGVDGGGADGGGADGGGAGGGVTGDPTEVVTEITPPVAFMEIAAAAGEAPTVLATPMPTELAEAGESVIVTIAATPFEMMLLLRPERRHV
jgi:hypothetical protein